MWTKKIYTLVCHSCGRFHELESEFLSSSVACSFPSTLEPKRSWMIPALACPDCRAIVTTDRNTHPIYLAWKNGSSPEARARMMAEWPSIEPLVKARYDKENN